MTSAVNQIDPPQVDDGLRARLAFWLRNDAAHLLWPARCLACGDRGGDGIDLCDACAAGLPWNRGACLRCAMPLPLPGPGLAAEGASASALGATTFMPRPPWRPGPVLQPVPMAPAGQDSSPVCGACSPRGRPTARLGGGNALSQVHAACLYAAPVDRLLLRFKFHRDLAAGGLLAQLMAQTCADRPRPDALLPVPLHRARLRQRGYDQALELARPLARALGLPVLDGAIHRIRATTAQSQLDAAQRRRNLTGAFAVPGGTRLPAHVVLVDDVMTTGATLRAAALTLRRAGVQRVDAWVCARVA